MDATVLAEVGGEAEGQATVRAHEGTVGGVDQPVAGQRPGPGEGLEADGALVALGAGRGPPFALLFALGAQARVRFELALGGESFTAAEAQQRPVGLEQDLLLLLPSGRQRQLGPQLRRPGLGLLLLRLAGLRARGGRQRGRLPRGPRLGPRRRLRLLLRGARCCRGGLLGALVLRAPARPGRLLGCPLDGQLDPAARVLLGQVAPELGRLREGAGAGGTAQRGLRPVATQVAREVGRPAEGLGA